MDLNYSELYLIYTLVRDRISEADPPIAVEIREPLLDKLSIEMCRIAKERNYEDIDRW